MNENVILKIVGIFALVAIARLTFKFFALALKSLFKETTDRGVPPLAEPTRPTIKAEQATKNPTCPTTSS